MPRSQAGSRLASQVDDFDDDDFAEEDEEALHELGELRKRYNLLEGDRKAFYEMTQWTIRQNKDTLSFVREENKELRRQLNEKLKGAKPAQRDPSLSMQEVHRLDQLVCDSRARFNQASKAVVDKEEELKVLTEQFKHTQDEHVKQDRMLEPYKQRLQLIEDRLEKAISKNEEASMITRTYGTILKRLQWERLTFDQRLASIEAALQAMEQDYNEMVNMSRDASYAKEVAKTELQRFQTELEKDRKHRDSEIKEKREYVRNKVDINERMERRRLEQEQMLQKEKQIEDEKKAQQALSSMEKQMQEQHKITTYQEAFKKIRESTGIADINDVVQKFVHHNDTLENLETMRLEAVSRIDAKNHEKASLKAKLEEIKYTATEAKGNRRLVDDSETKLSEANRRCEHNRLRYEHIAKILINVKAGVEHLADRLDPIKLENQPIIPLTEETIGDVMAVCEAKLSGVLDSIRDVQDRLISSGQETQQTIQEKTAVLEHQLSVNNYRVGPKMTLYRQAHVPPVEDEDMFFDDDDDILDREAIKKHSLSLADKSKKRTRRKHVRRKSTSGKSATSN